jgi:ribosomal protein S18 acetylase RimI-like enzyme
MPRSTTLHAVQNLSGKILVRQATAADVPRLCELLALLFAQETDFQPDATRQAHGLQLIVGQPEVGRIFCATHGDSIAGMVSILFTVSTAEGGRAAWLEDMIIHPSRRGQGIGDQLLRKAVSEAGAAGCRRISLLTDTNNGSAMRFYGRAGFVRSQMVPFRLSLRTKG